MQCAPITAQLLHNCTTAQLHNCTTAQLLHNCTTAHGHSDVSVNCDTVTLHDNKDDYVIVILFYYITIILDSFFNSHKKDNYAGPINCVYYL